MVRARPLLWHPRVPDYKSKDQRTQVWDDLKDLLTAPKGTTCTPKDVWESLVRCNNSALLRVKANKKSGSGADNSKPWKFLKQMEFLNPIKIIRNSKGNLPQERDEDDILQTAMIEADVSSEGEEVDVPEQLVAVVEKRAGSEQGGKKHKKKKVDDNDDDIISLLRKKIERKPESPRMGFFNSIMPRVETLDDDRFQELQLHTLQLLKKLKWTTLSSIL
ncbi:transcription factor Adf-1 [Elysia marginata]|uniref:Transcription factor Adf-1 n=1 Tax=Elysia marginata TaxID=1093978 RepID=A0AAV4JB47_9GAST|nr:transcription factor Adf-1 [Elysia marginata]